MAETTPPKPVVVVDEVDQKHVDEAPTDTQADSQPGRGSNATSPGPDSAATAASRSSLSPPTSPPASPPASTDARGSSGAEDYHSSTSSRPRYDRLGNPIPVRRHPSAISSVFGGPKVSLPGDLGPNDPRRPRSPAPSTLPGDLGSSDPRRQRSLDVSPALGSRGRSGSDASETVAPAEGERIFKDPKSPPPTPGEKPREESDNDADADNDNDTDAEADEGNRGRERKRPEPGKTTSGKSINVRADSEESDRAPEWAGGVKPDPTKGESKLSFQADPAKAPLQPSGSGKKRVHPSTAFDIPPSYSGPATSDDESHSELLAAQKLSLAMSNIHSTPSAHRVIRQILRGDYASFQQAAEEGRKRQRMYLVATDLSPESEYALEWTIGTVLRDGDTLFAVYAVDEETAGSSTGGGGVEIGRGADMVKDTAAVLHRLPTNAIPPASPGPSPLGKAADRSSSRGVFSSAESERRRALEDITARCIRILRKTRLQVRVVVEVFHCKSPRHMITEVIDFLSPTLVIIGSRGMSAVKGVLLGSFSNYLVTKSSVPVMVARKKLRKHSKTGGISGVGGSAGSGGGAAGNGSGVQRNRDGTAVPYTGTGRAGRFSNVIIAPKPKGLRVKGWEQVGID